MTRPDILIPFMPIKTRRNLGRIITTAMHILALDFRVNQSLTTISQVVEHSFLIYNSTNLETPYFLEVLERSTGYWVALMATPEVSSLSTSTNRPILPQPWLQPVKHTFREKIHWKLK